MGIIFFFLFALVLVGMYVAVRRQLASPGMIAGVGMLGSVISMTLYLLSRNASIIHGLVFGIILGAVFCLATLAIAWYFQSSEMRAEYESEDQ